MKFFPLTLGVPQRKTREERDSERPPRTYDEWREWVGRPEEFEPFPAEDILLRLMRGDPALPRRPWLILGEPGAGKTKLLEHWHATWLQALLRPYLGMKVPVLVRLNDVPRGTFKGDPGAVADKLWGRGLAVGQSQAKGTAAEEVFGLNPHVFTPVWLLDGLDELASTIADRGLWDSLRALPGETALTCRTAVLQAARTEIGDLIGSEWRILGLKPTREQAAFLAEAYADEKIDPTCAEEMVRDLNANASLRSLASVPLILRLVAEAGPRLKLPATRAGFYEAATNALWERRLRDRPELLDLAPERDATLAALAATMGLATETPKRALHQTGARPDLREALRRSGLLTFDDRRDRVGFPHPTFQEYHLARAFLPRPFRDVLNDYWSDARYEETLALLVALHAGEGRARMVEAELRDFVAKARVDHASNLPRLRLLGRSPLRTILHLLSRAAASPSLALPIELKDQPALLRFAIARDPLTPPAALAKLARDPDRNVRDDVAWNAATPPRRRWPSWRAIRIRPCAGGWRGTPRPPGRRWPSWRATRMRTCAGGWRGTPRPRRRRWPSWRATRIGTCATTWRGTPRPRRRRWPSWRATGMWSCARRWRGTPRPRRRRWPSWRATGMWTCAMPWRGTPGGLRPCSGGWRGSGER